VLDILGDSFYCFTSRSVARVAQGSDDRSLLRIWWFLRRGFESQLWEIGAGLSDETEYRDVSKSVKNSDAERKTINNQPIHATRR
jgi:hypothetical protein